jgi:hypothetical protein
VSPARLLDTRDGTGGWIGALATGQSIDLEVAGVAGIPDEVTGVLLNVTATDATGSAYVTVFPCGTDRPLASNLNVARGQTVANAVFAPLGEGKVCLFASAPLHLVVDVAGYVS